MIRIEDDGPVRVIAIDRPNARNAVNPETADMLFDAFLDFDRAPPDVAILTGVGGAFCAGFDLKAAAQMPRADWSAGLAIPDAWTDPAAAPLKGPMGPTRLALSKPVIAAIEGPAVAGGMELALWCDMRVMAQGSYTGVYCRRWGVPLIDGGTIRLPRTVGRGRAMDMILTGREVTAEEALRIGFADRLTPEGGALDASIALARDIARFPQACMRADRASAEAQWSLPLGAALRAEFASVNAFASEGAAGAARFAAGKGRGGDFDDI